MAGQADDERNGLPACGKRIEVPTADELAALDAMRNIKKQVRELKTRLSEIASGEVGVKPGEEASLKDALMRFKEQWESWERKRRKAAHERMVLLGHEQADWKE
jgi:hypothetical protein